MNRWPKVVVGCPMRNRAWVLPEYIGALIRLQHFNPEWKQPLVRGLFMVDRSEDETERVLRDLTPESIIRAVPPELETTAGHRRGEYGRDGYAHMAAVRNAYVEAFLETDADYLFSVDSDVIVPWDALQHLLSLQDGRSLVGLGISNLPGRPLDGRVPGNFMCKRKECGDALLHPEEYPTAGTLDVDVVGACYLIPRLVFDAGVRYAPDPQGEDLPFCRTAQAMGCRIIVSFDLKPEHRMSEPGQVN